MRKYFGTDGIRRIANTELTPELVYKVAKAGAYALSKHTDHAPTILIGRDTRLSGTLIESAMTAGFLSYGAHVKQLGVIPTPGVAYLTKRLKADASVVISASHNTYEFNGVKYFSNKGMKIPDEIEEEIEEIIESGRLEELTAISDKIGVAENREDLLEEYVFFFRKIFEEKLENYDKENFKVGLDVANGATYKVAEEVFKKLPRLCVGYMNRQSMQQNMQAITFDDIMFKKSLWEKIKNGISKSKSLQRDVEICTKIRGNDLL